MEFRKIGLAILVVLTTFSVNAQLIKIGSALPVIGNVLTDGLYPEFVEIRIFDGNEVVNIFNADYGQFELLLMPERTYTVEISKRGFVTKRVTFDTHMGGENYVLAPYELIVNLELPHAYGDSHAGILDYPLALIKLDETTGSFAHIPEYTETVKEMIDETSSLGNKSNKVTAMDL